MYTCYLFDGENIENSKKSKNEFQLALKLFPKKNSEWIPKVLTCSSINGKGLEEIPVKCERKKVQPRRQIKDALTTRIKVVPKGIDYYYGVELDGNHRYLLGDFTVTHNTVIALNLASQLKKKTLTS